MMNQLTSEILFRCPCCQKLYCTDSDGLNMHDSEAKNEFQCSQCEEDFFLSAERNEVGLLKTEPRKKYDFSACSKCGFLKNPQHEECPSCGVIETKYNDLVKLENPRLFELNKKWSQVLLDLTNDQLHQEFLGLSQNMMALNFAAQKYNELKKIMGMDPLPEKYLAQIELRLEQVVQSKMADEKNKNLWANLEGQSGSAEFSFKKACIVLSAVAAVLFVLNLFRPTFPTLNGLLIATVVLSLSLWSLSKGQSANN